MDISLNALNILDKTALHLVKKQVVHSIIVCQFNAVELKNINKSFPSIQQILYRAV